MSLFIIVLILLFAAKLRFPYESSPPSLSVPLITSFAPEKNHGQTRNFFLINLILRLTFFYILLVVSCCKPAKYKLPF